MLNKFVYEIEEMPSEEFDRWFDYFEWKDKEQKKAEKKANQKSKSGNKRVQTY